MTIYFDDIEAGREVVTARRTVTEADILWFCGISGDFNPLHTDIEFIREHTPFRERIAHGHLVLSITGGLRSELDNWRIVAYLDCQRRFLAPVYAGDTIHGAYAVTDVRPSRSRPGTGVVVCDVRTVNQAGDIVHQGTDVLLVSGRPDGGERGIKVAPGPEPGTAIVDSRARARSGRGKRELPEPVNADRSFLARLEANALPVRDWLGRRDSPLALGTDV